MSGNRAIAGIGRVPVFRARLLFWNRVWMGGFIVGLVLSGVTAFPLLWQMEVLASWLGAGSATVRDLAEQGRHGAAWVVRVREALRHADANYPFLAYGTDWLGFAHLVIAAAFVGPWRDPVRHKFIIDWGLFCCAAVIPLALIAGEVRGIPWWWRGIDCSFGVVGAVPLLICRRIAGKLERA